MSNPASTLPPNRSFWEVRWRGENRQEKGREKGELILNMNGKEAHLDKG